MRKRKPDSPAVRCPVCRKKVALRRDGMIRVHGYNPHGEPRAPCPGGGAPVKRSALNSTTNRPIEPVPEERT